MFQINGFEWDNICKVPNSAWNTILNKYQFFSLPIWEEGNKWKLSFSKTAEDLCKFFPLPSHTLHWALGSFRQRRYVSLSFLQHLGEGLINSYWFDHWLKHHWGCQVTSVVALWGPEGLVCWSTAALRQGRLHNWNVLSPSLIKIRASLIGRQRLCSLHGIQKGAECALNVNFPCSLHLKVGDEQGRGRTAEGHNALYIRSSCLVAISLKCP